MRRSLKFLGVLAATSLLLAASYRPLLRGYEAALLLEDIAARDGASRLKDKTPVPRREELEPEGSGHRYRADIYSSSQTASASLLLIPGAAQGGKDDPRLVAFAVSLARAGFNVLVPDFKSLKQLNVSSLNIDEFAEALTWLTDQPELCPSGRAGILAFSYASGPAILAAMRKGVQDRVSFIYAIGGYYDLEAALGFVTTGYFREGNGWGHIEPNIYGKWVFVLSNLGRLNEPRDRKLFRAMFKRKQLSLGAELDELATGLSEEGKNLYTFIINTDPERVAALLSKLPEAIRSEISALNLAGKDLSRLKARMILVHGLDDGIIHHSQSLALSKALPATQADLYLIDNLVHVELKPGLIGSWHLLRAVSALLKERDALALEVEVTQ